MSQKILHSAFNLYEDGFYGKSLFAYKLFKIFTPELSKFVFANVNILQKRMNTSGNCLFQYNKDNNIKLRLLISRKTEVLLDFFEKIVLDFNGDIVFHINYAENNDKFYDVIMEFIPFFGNHVYENDDYYNYVKNFVMKKNLLDKEFFYSYYRVMSGDLFEYYQKVGFDKKYYSSKKEACYIDTDLIVSLTSYGSRIETVHLVVESLLNQNVKGYTVILWLAETEFENKNKDLPKELTSLLSNRFLIKWTKDIKSYKKLIPALREFPDATIVTADDDILYPENWLELLYIEHLKYPEHVIAHRVHRIKERDRKILPYTEWSMRYSKHGAYYRNFFTGAGGVLYPKNSLHKDVLREDLFMELAPSADDFWFWSMCLRNRTKIMIPKKIQKHLNYVTGTQEVSNTNVPLHKINVESGRNDAVLNKMMNFYPEIKELLLSERKFDPVELVFISDENYVGILSVVICSLMENKFDCTNYSINILLDNVQDKKVFNDLSQFYGITINLVDVNSNDLSALHIGGDKYCTASEAALLKFKIADILKEKKKVLYLDVDILVNKDLTELYSFDISKLPLAAILESGQLYSERSKKFSKRYFNSGVLLMNLDFFRENNLVERLVHEKKKLKDYSLMDQHVFNIVFKNHFLELPITYNFLYTNLSRASGKFSIEQLNALYNSNYEGLEAVLQQSHIVHFASKDKPWKYTNVPFSKKWYEFYRKSSIGNEPLIRVVNDDWRTVSLLEDGI